MELVPGVLGAAYMPYPELHDPLIGIILPNPSAACAEQAQPKL